MSKRLVMGFESKYALRLFEMLSLRKNLRKNTEVFDIDDLRSRLGVDVKQYALYGGFKQRVLDVAVDEVTKLTDIIVTYKPIRQGKAVRSIQLTWSSRVTIENELKDVPKPGSTSEPTPVLETKAPEPRWLFPTETSIYGIHPWHGIADRCCPGYDLELLTKGFRSLAARKQGGFPLSGPNLEARFTSYCQEKASATLAARARARQAMTSSAA